MFLHVFLRHNIHKHSHKIYMKNGTDSFAEMLLHRKKNEMEKCEK